MAAPPPEPKRSVSIVPCFVFVELSILGGTALLAYALEFTAAFPSLSRGFFCGDAAIARPDPGPPGASRAPPALVYGLVTAVPSATIVAGELWALLGGPRGGRDPPILWGRCCLLGPLLRRLLRFLGVFVFGLLATAIGANAAQLAAGAPAPHFLAVCRPNYTALGCAPPAAGGGAAPGTPPRFVAAAGGAACAGDPPLVAAARRAFPCKEAALGAYAGAYAALYVTLGWRGGGSRLARPAAALALVAPPLALGALRVAEHRNHRADVLAGLAGGAASAAFLVTCVVGNFQSKGGAQGGGAGDGGPPAAPPELPRAQPPLEEISVTQPLRAEFPAVT
ncbi:phospholipid phosphatase-related protein type 2-like [Eudromia elegans]